MVPRSGFFKGNQLPKTRKLGSPYINPETGKRGFPLVNPETGKRGSAPDLKRGNGALPQPQNGKRGNGCRGQTISVYIVVTSYCDVVDNSFS